MSRRDGEPHRQERPDGEPPARSGPPDTTARSERTALAWNRSLLAFAANGVLLLQVGTTSGWWIMAVGGVVLSMTVLGWLVTSRTYRRLHARRAERNRGTVRHGPGRRMRMATWAALAVGVFDVGAILTSV